MEHPAPLVNALGDGALMDLRMKLAIQLLQAPGFLHNVFDPELAAIPPKQPPQTHHSPGSAAFLALETAEALYAQAKTRGWIEPLPVDAALPPGEVACAQRGAELQVRAQLHANKIGQDIQECAMRIAKPFQGMNG